MTATDCHDRTPSITWAELETLLLGLADSETKRLIVQYLVEGTRKQARYLTPTGTLTEIIYIGAALLDVDFRPPAAITGSSCASWSSSSSPP